MLAKSFCMDLGEACLSEQRALQGRNGENVYSHFKERIQNWFAGKTNRMGWIDFGNHNHSSLAAIVIITVIVVIIVVVAKAFQFV